MFLKKVIGIAAILSVVFLQLSAQRTQFVYLQTETMEPFFVVLNKKNISSSSAGHVILSGLQPGTYRFQVGFPGNNPLQEYSVSVSAETDQGFLVKKSGEGEYALVNLQTGAVQQSGEEKKALAEAEKQKAAAEALRLQEETLAKQQAEEQAKQRAEAEALAAKEQEQKMTAAKTEEEARKRTEMEKAAQQKQAEEATQTKTEQTAGTSKAEEVVAEQKQSAVENTAARVTPQGNNTASAKAAEATGAQVAVIGAAGVLSAAEIARLQDEARKIDARGQRDSALAAEKSKPAAKTSQPVFLDIEMNMPDSATKESGYVEVPKDVAAPKKEELLEQPKTSPVVIAPVAVTAAGDIKTDTVPKPEAAKTNPNCTGEATDAELDLISQMVKREKDPEDGIDMLKKTMKVKCINTVQLRKLCLIFAADQHRYALLDIAYRYTTDQDKFAQLSDLLTDVYYLNRFKAMLQ
jgi:hypothetical protein